MFLVCDLSFFLGHMEIETIGSLLDVVMDFCKDD